MSTADAGSGDQDRSADDASLPSWSAAPPPAPPAVPPASIPPLTPAPAHPPMPRLPSAQHDEVAPPTLPTGAPAIPPLETTAPTDLVAPGVRDGNSALADRPSDDFSPLRVDPPPSLITTWWLRWLIFVLFASAPAAALLVEYTGEIDDVSAHPAVVLLHLAAIGSIMAWSAAAMRNANRLVPATKYQRRSDPGVALILWVAACAAPFFAAMAFGIIDDRSADAPASGADVTAEATSDSIEVLMLAAVVLAALVVVWLPFRYHARHAARVGAPRRIMLTWFFGPLLAVVGGICILALGLQDQLATGGLTPSERVIQVGVLYGLPMLMLALTTWRAITVFDEVIDLRWRRWKAEWEQTINEFVRQPTPGPEDSPDVSTINDGTI